jgi:hypothetical protein
MIDTLKLTGPWRCCQPLPAGRLIWTKKRVIRVWTDQTGTSVRSVECSLPKLLFGSNGHTLTSQEHIDAALRQLLQELTPFIEISMDAPPKASRVDLACDFAVDPTPIILGHAYTRIVGIRSAPARFGDGDGISWGSYRSRFCVRFYNKSRQMRVRGSVLRVEISLRREKLRQNLPYETWQQWEHCWECFRKILAEIPPLSLTPARNLVEAIASEPEIVRNRIIAKLSMTKSKRSIRRYGQLLETGAAFAGSAFSWSEFLCVRPLHHHLHPNGTTRTR